MKIPKVNCVISYILLKYIIIKRSGAVGLKNRFFFACESVDKLKKIGISVISSIQLSI